MPGAAGLSLPRLAAQTQGTGPGKATGRRTACTGRLEEDKSLLWDPRPAAGGLCAQSPARGGGRP